MRILCTCIPSTGRFLVLAPLARALQDAGHEVTFAAPADFAAVIAQAGFQTFEAGLSLAELRERARGDTASRAPDRLAFSMFARHAPPALAGDLLRAGGGWEPSVVLHEEGEYGGPLLAATLGVPSVVVGWPSPLRPPGVLERLDAALGEISAPAGSRRLTVAGVYRHLFLDTCPPPLQAPHAWDIGSRRPLRPVIDGEAGAQAGSVSPLPGTRTVHVTFGTVLEALALVRAIVGALREEDVRVVLTVGEHDDPDAFGPPGDRLIVSPYVPHAALLPGCDLVVCHGGAGTTVAALAHGLPLLVIPCGGASQHRGALACEQAGVARVLRQAEMTPRRIRAEVAALLQDGGYRRAAETMARTIAAMPDPRRAVEAIEKLAGAGRA